MENPLLARLIDQPAPPKNGRLDLASALRHLGIHSVFDIVQLSKQAFAEQLAQHNDDDAEQVYRRALSAALQLDALFRNRQVSLPPTQSANTPSPRVGATYPALFNENWHQYCARHSIAALDSPAAYLRALSLFVIELEKRADKNTAVKLADRRPDLKKLVIDAHSVSVQRPMLSIINQMLTDAITQGQPKSAYALLNDARYPFSLPYHFYHQQCQLALSGNTPALGELNYRISRQLPVVARAPNAYGEVLAHNNDIQCLLSGLSPTQLTLLGRSLVSDVANTLDKETFYRDYYNLNQTTDSKALADLGVFLHHTQLDAAALQALLAQKIQKPRISPSCRLETTHAYGACYVNGPANHPPLDIDQTTLLNLSTERLDRLQRMIRLQRWFATPFAQLDTLLVSTMRCEAEANTSLLINHNTLRALGVYRYLHRHYGLQAEEFAALVHLLPVHASGEHTPLFDQVFNQTGTVLPALQLDDQAFNATTRQQLCAALGLHDTADSLQLLIGQAPRRSLEQISAIYRHARIARLFGLSVKTCIDLVSMLGQATFAQQLFKPWLRQQPKGAADILDVLLHLEWASRWLKERGGSLPLLRHQLLLEPLSLDPVVKRLIDAFSTHRPPDLPSMVNDAALPQQPEDERGSTEQRLPAVDWVALARRVVHRSRDMHTADALDKELADVEITHQGETRRSSLIQQAKGKLLPILTKLRGDVWQQYLELKKIINDLQDQGEVLVLTKYDFEFLRLHPSSAPSSHTLGYLILLLPHAADYLQLPINRKALQRFLINPHWLNERYQPNSLLELDWNNLVSMQQFKQCIERYNLSQEQLFDYLEQANTCASDADAQLARLLGWSAEEIKVLSNTLTPACINSMDRLDWVLRCRQTCMDSGLSVDMLLKASQLTTHSTFDEWRAVGEAVSSALQSSSHPFDLLKD